MEGTPSEPVKLTGFLPLIDPSHVECSVVSFSVLQPIRACSLLHNIEKLVSTL